MQGKDTRHRKKRRDLKYYKKRHDVKPKSATQGIIAPTTSQSAASSGDDDDDDKDEAGPSGHRGNFSRRPITSNWAFYEEPGQTEAERFASQPEEGDDFEEGAEDRPATPDYSKFISKNDWENWLPDPGGEYLTSNDELLTAGLRSIPFYTRFKIDKRQFSQEAIERMDNEAASAAVKYKKLLAEHEAKQQKECSAEPLQEDYLKPMLKILQERLSPLPSPSVHDNSSGAGYGLSKTPTEAENSEEEEKEDEQRPQERSRSSSKADRTPDSTPKTFSESAKVPEITPGPSPKSTASASLKPAPNSSSKPTPNASPKPTQEPCQQPISVDKDDDSELDDLLKLTERMMANTFDERPTKTVIYDEKPVEKEEQKKEVVQIECPLKKQDDIQQWLDDVLNE